MKRIKLFGMFLCILAVPLLVAGCLTCIGISSLPVTTSTNEITHENITFKSAILPSGSPSGVEVNDYCPPAGDGVNEVVIGWSQTDAGTAEFAQIVFDSGVFPTGVSKVEVTCMHYNACRMEAYDSDMNLVDSDDHTAGERVLQTLVLDGPKIFTIKVIGAEIGITKFCYEE